MLSRASVWTMKVGCSCDSSSVTKVYLSLHGYSLVELVLVICYRAVVNSCALNDLWETACNWLFVRSFVSLLFLFCCPAWMIAWTRAWTGVFLVKHEFMPFQIELRKVNWPGLFLSVTLCHICYVSSVYLKGLRISLDGVECVPANIVIRCWVASSL